MIVSDHGAILLEASPKKTRGAAKACKTWCLERKKQLGITWDIITEELSPLQTSIKEEKCGDVEIRKRKECIEKAKTQHMYWKQRAKNCWDNLGNQCTSFFFRSVKMRKGRNWIKSLKEEDCNWIHEEEEVVNCFQKHFVNLFNPNREDKKRLDERRCSILFWSKPDSCNVIRDTLEEFCEISGEIINYKKSHVQFSRNTPTKFIHFMRKPLGVGSQQNMGTYLGCPLDVDGRSTMCFTSIHDKILKCISSWKYSCLSTTGRSILINSVLMALAAHIMNIYLFPRKLLNKINSTILRFFWGGNKGGKPIYWKKNQNLLELRKEEGGIGLRNVSSLNQALLF
ncbi:hypothetical protein RDABS01_014533 [Bienertia sinuspersici]